ncbi:MAG TPA: aminotransferase class IV [Candidatus Saccharimonadales bacterium]|jgi:branched-subunit amino acid aminotransferase/4-amino-4-deoxychorismate lyase|nr:aminotransferase class IV [Candidatus Saccharimonadales bacterium]
MSYRYFSHNGELLPIEQAGVPLSRVEYAYGFGVYESIRVTKGMALFLADHIQRLLKSAEIIGLEHNFSLELAKQSVLELIDRNSAETCNIKILLIGGRDKDSATLDILCLNPLFPNRQLYKTGAKVITYNYEREFPQAKTLNMLSSYLAYRKARQANAYDALLIDRQGNIREGTRTNFFGLRSRTITSPPEDQILPGVTRAKVIEVANQNGFQLIKQPIPLDQVNQFDATFLTSTSSKIMPISQINDNTFDSPPAALQELMQAFNAYLTALIDL